MCDLLQTGKRLALLSIAKAHRLHTSRSSRVLRHLQTVVVSVAVLLEALLPSCSEPLNSLF